MWCRTRTLLGTRTLMIPMRSIPVSSKHKVEWTTARIIRTKNMFLQHCIIAKMSLMEFQGYFIDLFLRVEWLGHNVQEHSGLRLELVLLRTPLGGRLSTVVPPLLPHWWTEREDFADFIVLQSAAIHENILWCKLVRTWITVTLVALKWKKTPKQINKIITYFNP